MFDGACLVNLIHDLSSQPTMDELGDLFQTYFERRYPAARIAIEGSSQFSRLFHDQVNTELKIIVNMERELGTLLSIACLPHPLLLSINTVGTGRGRWTRGHVQQHPSVAAALDVGQQ